MMLTLKGYKVQKGLRQIIFARVPFMPSNKEGLSLRLFPSIAVVRGTTICLMQSVAMKESVNNKKTKSRSK